MIWIDACPICSFTYASDSVTYVRDQMGHSSIQVTVDVYGTWCQVETARQWPGWTMRGPSASIARFALFTGRRSRANGARISPKRGLNASSASLRHPHGSLNSAATAQQPSPPPRFEVASIKLWSPPTTPVAGIRGPAAPANSGIFNRSTNVARLIAEAYEVQDFQLSDGEGWVRTERYDVAARAGREVSQAELREMVKALLADRFKLRVRTETREMTILELRLARSDGRVGPNLHDCSNANDKEGVSTPEKPFRAPRNGAVATADCPNGLTHLVTIASRQLQTTVVDKTGLTGQWRFNVYFGSELTIPGIRPEPANPDLPSFVGALQEQLGLRLERTRGPVPVIVIESVERPTPN